MQEACFGGWRWVHSSLDHRDPRKGMVHEPSTATIAEWREILKEVIKGGLAALTGRQDDPARQDTGPRKQTSEWKVDGF